MEIIGGYLWVAILKDGTRIEQLADDGIETSVDILNDKEIKEIQLYPIRDLCPTCNKHSHPFISLDVDTDEDWIKYWLREKITNLDTESEIQLPDIDVIGLIPQKGKRSRKPVRLFIFPDGSIKVTTKKDL